MNHDKSSLTILKETLEYSLLQMTENDPVAALVSEVIQWFDTAKVGDKARSKIQTLLKEIKQPAYLIDPAYLSEKGLTLLTPQHPLFKPLQQVLNLMDETETALLLKPYHAHPDSFTNVEQFKMTEAYKNICKKYERFRELIAQLRQYYQTYITQVCTTQGASRELLLRPWITVRGSDRLMHRYLKRKYEKELMPPELTNENTVVEYNLGEGTHHVRQCRELNVYVKFNPEAPWIEFAVQTLNRLINQQAITPSMLLHFQTQTHSYAVLASQTVQGQRLNELLLQHPEYWEKTEHRNFSALIILSLLTDPEDWKMGNLIARSTTVNETIQVKIVGIDNDEAFAIPVVQSGKVGEHYGKHTVEVKNILYAFPGMLQPVDTEVLHTCQKLDPVAIVFNWWMALYEKNQYYERLVEMRIFSKEELMEMGCPIKLLPNTLSQLQNKLQQIKQLLTETPTMTLMQLFAAVEPIPQLYYQQLLTLNSDEAAPLEKLIKIWEGICQPYGNKLTIEDTLDLNAIVAKKSVEEHLKSSTIRDRNYFKKNRTQNLLDALKDWLAQLDGKLLTSATQQLLLHQLSRVKSLQHLTFYRWSELTDDNLINLAKVLAEPNIVGHLQTLRLIGCPYITVAQGLNEVHRLHPKVIFTIDDCPQLGVENWDTLLTFCPTFNLILPGGALLVDVLDPYLWYKASQLQSPDWLEKFFFERDLAKKNFEYLVIKTKDLNANTELPHEWIKHTLQRYVRYLEYKQATKETCNEAYHNLTAEHRSLLMEILQDHLKEKQKIQIHSNSNNNNLAQDKFPFNFLTPWQHVQDNRTQRSLLQLAVWDNLSELAHALISLRETLQTPSYDGSLALHSAAARGHTSLVKELLTALRQQIKSRDEQQKLIEVKNQSKQTLLHLAAINGHTETIKTLLEEGANVNSLDFAQQTPLHGASTNNKLDAVKLLIENGANTESKDDRGQTALHYATAYGNEALVKTLLESGANYEARNNKNQTPHALALAMKKNAIAQYLQDAIGTLHRSQVAKINTLQRQTQQLQNTVSQLQMQMLQLSKSIAISNSDPSRSSDKNQTISPLRRSNFFS